MFDAEYFEDRLLAQHRAIKGNASTEVHLHDGTVFHIYQVSEALPGYVLLETYPADDPVTKTEMRAVAYESIAHVIVTTASVGEKRITGFQDGSRRK